MPRTGPIAIRAAGSSFRLPRMVVCALALSGCAPELPSPELSVVSPDWGFRGDDTRIEIQGSGLYPSVSAIAGGEVEWDRQYQAWLVDADGQASRLQGVELQDYEHLLATVPAGLEADEYTLRVRTPGGAEVELEGAFQVTDTRADHLELTADPPIATIGEYAVIEVRLLDPEENLVQEDLPITVTLEVEGDREAVSFSGSTTLDGQAPLEDELGVTGSLGSTGLGFFAITSSALSDVTVVVSPTDEDSPIPAEVTTVSFAPGPVAKVAITLPTFVAATAGTGFNVDITLLDEEDNPTENAQAALYLREACPAGSYGEIVFVLDRLENHPVTVTGATNLACAENQVLATGILDGEALEGASEGFEVLPGEPASLLVSASPETVVAGEEPLHVMVVALDEFGNVAEDHDASISLVDSVGGLDPVAGLGLQLCSDFSSGLAITTCDAWLWTSGRSVTLTATDSAGNTGESNEFTVEPSDADGLVVSVESTEVTAGERFDVVVRAVDALGNTLDVPLYTLGDVSFADDHGAAACEIDSDSDVLEGTPYTCVLTKADPEDTLVATLTTPDLRHTASSDSFAVINGALTSVHIGLGGTTEIEAGEAMNVSFAGFDDHGNPYVEGDERTITLSDDSGTLVISGGGTAATLDEAGEASVALVFTAAFDDNRVYAARGGATLGSSDTFDVRPGELNGFVVQAQATWAWLDEPLGVVVVAEDRFGNPVDTFEGEGTLRSSDGLGDDVSVDTWTDGVASLSFTWDEAGLSDMLELAVDGDTVATSHTIDALDPDCADGPVAEVTVAGDAPATLCLNDGATPTATVSAAGSDAGGASLSWYHYDLGDGDWTRSRALSKTTTWTEEAAWRVNVIVADADACGDLATVDVYVAENDGRPAGPVTVELADATLNNGLDETVATITALDCTGDPADGELLARADLGDLESGPSSALTSTGAGLALEVSRGEGDVIWSVVDERYAGVATLRVGTASGAAYGEVEATVSGDQARPLVLSVSPHGTWLDAFDEISVLFSEAIDVDSLDRMPVSLTLRTGEAVELASVSLDDAQTTMTIALVESQEGGPFVLTLPADLRDESGNRLNGEWAESGTASDLVLTFGDVASEAPEITGCTTDTSVFRPDGDAGEGEEADEVVIRPTAGSAPEWWRLVVTDAFGEDILVKRFNADTSSGLLPWNGRDQEGFVVGEGEYTIAVTSEDEYWNTGTTCTTTVTVDHRVAKLP